MSIPLTRDNQESHLATIWEALVALEDAVATPEPFAQWDDICTAMAWIREDLGLCSELEREQQLEDEEVTS